MVFCFWVLGFLFVFCGVFGGFFGLASLVRNYYLRHLPAVAMSIVRSFLLLSHIPLCRYNKVFLAIQLLMDIWLVSSFSQRKLKLLQTFLYKYLYHHRISFLLANTWEENGWDIWQMFSKAVALFYILITIVWEHLRVYKFVVNSDAKILNTMLVNKIKNVQKGYHIISKWGLSWKCKFSLAFEINVIHLVPSFIQQILTEHLPYAWN